MKKEKKPEQFIRQPTYPGGIEAMREYIKKNLRYPDEALKSKVEGTVSVAYEVDNLGDVIDAKVKSGIGYGCDEEALRLAKALKFVVPKHRGLRVTFHKTINIHFRLPVAPPPREMSSTQLVYTYIEKKKEEKPGYTYNISVKGG